MEALEAVQKRSGETKTVGLAEDRAGEVGWEWGCGGPEGHGLADGGILRAAGDGRREWRASLFLPIPPCCRHTNPLPQGDPLS